MMLHEVAQQVRADAISMRNYIAREGREVSGTDLDAVLLLIANLASVAERLALLEAPA